MHAAMLPPCSSLPWGHFIAQIMKLNTLRSIKRLMISSSGQLYQYILILPSHKILQSSLTTNWMLRQVSVSEISFTIILFDPFVWFYHVIIQIFRLFDIYSHSVLRSSVFLKNDLLLVVQCSSCWLAPGQWFCPVFTDRSGHSKIDLWKLINTNTEVSNKVLILTRCRYHFIFIYKWVTWVDI